MQRYLVTKSVQVGAFKTNLMKDSIVKVFDTGLLHVDDSPVKSEVNIADVINLLLEKDFIEILPPEPKFKNDVPDDRST